MGESIADFIRKLNPSGKQPKGDNFDAGYALAVRHAAERETGLRAEVERLRANRRETFEAMVAMRDTINEAVPIPSLESDLSRGPDDAIFCEVVATAVVTEAARLRAEVNTLATENADYVRELFAVSSERDRHCAEAARLRALLDEARGERDDALARLSRMCGDA